MCINASIHQQISSPHEVTNSSVGGSGGHQYYHSPQMGRSNPDTSFTHYHHLYHNQHQHLDPSSTPEHVQTPEGPVLTAYGKNSSSSTTFGLKHGVVSTLASKQRL